MTSCFPRGAFGRVEAQHSPKSVHVECGNPAKRWRAEEGAGVTGKRADRQRAQAMKMTRARSDRSSAGVCAPRGTISIVALDGVEAIRDTSMKYGFSKCREPFLDLLNR